MQDSGDAKLPKLGQSSSTGALNQATAVSLDEGIKKASSTVDLRRSSRPEAPPPLDAVIKFTPGYSGLRTEGATVTGAALQAWMKGVRPGWTVRTVAGAFARDGDEAEELLRAAAEGSAKYEIGFEKGRSKFGVQADIAAREEAEKERVRLKVRRTFTYQGAVERAEHRGITLDQLERVVIFASENCSTWTDQTSKSSKPPKLRIDTLSLHHLNHWVILPATQPKQCSFVEVLTDQRQVPCWFVSHWWGEPVVDSMECVRIHSSIRGTQTNSPYWICAYAHRQHQLKDELALNPRKTAFYKALQVCRHHVLFIIDRQAAVFSRTWCLFEASMCLDHASAQIDLAVCHRSQAKLLTHGLTKSEEERERQEPREGIGAKAARESDFPLERALRGLDIDLRHSDTTAEAERERILNVFAESDPQSPPAEEHPKLDEANIRLRAFFAAVLFGRALVHEKGNARRRAERGAKVSQALREDVWLPSLDAQLQGVTVDGMELFMQSLPQGLKELKLRLQGSSIADDDLRALAEVLPNKLESISLDIRNCRKLTSFGAIEFKKGLEAANMVVDMSLSETEALQFIQEFERPRKDMSVAFHMSLVRKPEMIDNTRLRMVPSVPLLVQALTTDEKSYVRSAAARALGSLRDKASEAVPALTKAVDEDTEEMVKHAAKLALAKVRGGEAN